MIEGTEISPGLWALQNRETERNTIALFDAAGEGPLVAVDPGDTAVELDALGRFAEEMGRRVGIIAFTQEADNQAAVERWPGSIVFAPSENEASQLPFPVPGWESVVLAPGRTALFHKKAATLLTGPLLRQGIIPELSAGADNYLQALEGIEALDPKRVITRQGKPAVGKREVRARLAADRDYTQNLTRHVLTSIAAHLPFDRVQTVARNIYEDYPFLEGHLRNLERVWDELTGGSR